MQIGEGGIELENEKEYNKLIDIDNRNKNKHDIH